MRVPIFSFRLICVLCFMPSCLLSESAFGNKLNFVLKFGEGHSDLSYTVLTDKEAIADEAHQGKNTDQTPKSVTYSSNSGRAVLYLKRCESNKGRHFASVEWADGHSSNSPMSFRYFFTLSECHLAILANASEEYDNWIKLGAKVSLTTITNLPLFDLTGEHAHYLGFQRVRITPYGSNHIVRLLDSGIWEHNILLRAYATTTENMETEILIAARLHLNNSGEPVWAEFLYNSAQFTMTLQGDGTIASPPSTSTDSAQQEQEEEEQEYETQEVEFYISSGSEDEQDAQAGLQRNEAIEQLNLPGRHPFQPDFPSSAAGQF